MTWENTTACQSLAVCRDCRSSQSFRESVTGIYGGPVDYPCRVGLPIVGQRRGLGDWLAWLLHLIGVRRRPGCKCGERQSRLNRAGAWLTRLWRG